MDKTFNDISYQTSQLVTKAYSTSFAIGVRCLHPTIRNAIYSIYGFVRFADEIVDTFHEYNKEKLFNLFEKNYYSAIEEGISLNPILNSFHETVKKYSIEDELVQAFLRSMKCDLYKKDFTESEIKDYIYGSADVVGLMCLRVFVKGNNVKYEELKPYAMRLGTAFQKINFLRDLKHDTNDLHRIYFPILKSNSLNEQTKDVILKDILEDFNVAKMGINQLPLSSRLGVYTAYLYYLSLTKRIQKTPANELFQKRISVPTYIKIMLFCKAFVQIKMIYNANTSKRKR